MRPSAIRLRAVGAFTGKLSYGQSAHTLYAPCHSLSAVGTDPTSTPTTPGFQ